MYIFNFDKQTTNKKKEEKQSKNTKKTTKETKEEKGTFPENRLKK